MRPDLRRRAGSHRAANITCAALLIAAALPIGAAWALRGAAQTDAPDAAPALRLLYALASAADGRWEAAAAWSPWGASVWVALWVLVGFSALVLAINVVKFGINREEPRPLDDPAELARRIEEARRREASPPEP